MQKQKIIRLAHLIQCSHNLSVDYQGDLIINVLYHSKSALTLQEIETYLEEILGLQMNRIAIEKGITSLLSRGLVLEQKSKYILSVDANENIKRIANQLPDLEKKILNNWVGLYLLPKYPDLKPDQIGQLKADLVSFLNELFLRHGASSIELLGGSITDEAGLAVSNIIDSISVIAPELRQLRSIEFPIFLGSTDADAIRYFSTLIAKAISYLSIVCDPQIFQTLNQNIKGKIVYLDTNIIYRLFGLQGKHRLEVMDSVKTLCKEFGLSLRVTSSTVDELRRRIHYDSRVLREYPVPKHFACIGQKYISDENFVSTYWNEASKSGISVKDFIDYYSHVPELLQEMRIFIDNDEEIVSQKTRDRINELQSSLRKYDESNSSQRQDFLKSNSAIQHDAVLIGLVESKNDTSTSFLNSTAWILTADKGITGYVKSDPFLRNRPPFVLLPSQLIQILSFIRPADEQFDKTFLGIFSRSFIPSQLTVSNDTIHEILGRIAKYQGTPLLADKILSNNLLLQKYNSINDEGERDELIHDSLIEAAKIEIDDKETKIKEVTNQVIEAKEQISAAYDDICAEQKKNEVLQEELNNLKTQICEKEITMNKSVTELAQQAEKLRITLNEVETEKSVLNDKLESICLIFRVVSLLAILVADFLIYHSANLLWIKISVMALSIVLIVFILFGFRNGKNTAVWIGYAYSIIGTTYSLFGS